MQGDGGANGGKCTHSTHFMLRVIVMMRFTNSTRPSLMDVFCSYLFVFQQCTCVTMSQRNVQPLVSIKWQRLLATDARGR